MINPVPMTAPGLRCPRRVMRMVAEFRLLQSPVTQRGGPERREWSKMC